MKKDGKMQFLTKSGGYRLGFCIYIFALSLTYIFWDAVYNQMNGVDVWEAVADGRFLDYYQMTFDTSMPALYSFTLYAIYGIWNLPCYIFQHISGIEATSNTVCIYYGKMIILIGYYGAVYAFHMLIQTLDGIKNRKTSPIDANGKTMYFAVSILMLTYTVFAGLPDIWPIMCVLFGIDALLNNKTGKFLILFSLAISMKYFALWVAIPIILLKEKRILYIARNLLCCIMIDFTERIVFNIDAVIKANGFNQFTYSRFSDVARAGMINLGSIGGYSICFVSYALLCIYCYAQKKDDNNYTSLKIPYVCTAAWGLFFFLAPFSSQWIVWLVPFLCIVVVMNDKNLYINVLLEFLFSSVMWVVLQVHNTNVVGQEWYLSNHRVVNIFLRLFGMDVPETMGDTIGLSLVARGLANENTMVYFNSAALALFMAILLFNYPKDSIQKHLPEVSNELITSRKMVLIRNTLNIVMSFIPTLYYVGKIYNLSR